MKEYIEKFGCILYINKPKDITSFDVVKKIRHIYGIKRVGHTGTLDPLATGVMIVALGKATKIVELLTAYDKEYIATAELGYETDTYDNTGTILREKEVPENIPLEETIKSFQKTYLQEAPIYSAIKMNGKKLYDYARQKQEVILPKREVTIKEIELIHQEKNSFQIRAFVTKGCYIRSLIHDIGLSLNTYATMTDLVRTKQGKVLLEKTNTLEEVEQGLAREYKIEEVLDYPIIEVTEEQYQKIKNGVMIPNTYDIKDKVIFQYHKELVGIYEVKENNLITWKNFT
jgi:tRNA pseudouridine55 synthase